MEKSKLASVNPWTNKARVRGEGMLNTIMNKYLNEQCLEEDIPSDDLSAEERNIKQIALKVRDKYNPSNKIDPAIAEMFQLKKRCEKIDEVLGWMQKIESRRQNKDNDGHDDEKSLSKSVSIDSSFVYLPAYVGNTLHLILKQCASKENKKIIGDNLNKNIKDALYRIKQLEDLSSVLSQNIY